MSPQVEIRKAEGLRRLSELMLRVNSSVDLPELLHEVVTGVVEVLGYGVASISEVRREMLVCKAAAGPPEAVQQLEGVRSPTAGLLRFHIATAERARTVLEVPHDIPSERIHPLFPPGSLYAPLVNADNELLGCLTVSLRPEDPPPTPAEFELLELFAIQAGLAMHLFKSRGALHKRVRLSAVTRSVADGGEPDALTQTLITLGPRIEEEFALDALRVRIFRAEEGGGAAQVLYPAASGTEVEQQVCTDLARDALDMGAAIEIDVHGSTEEDPSSHAQLARKLLFGHDHAGALIAPVALGRELLGYVVMARRGAYEEWDDAEREGVMELGRALARIVINGRLLTRERELVEELQALDTYRTELIATISHELKTPLTAIIGHMELLQDSDHDDISVAAIARNAQRLDRLVANLLTYSRAIHTNVGERRIIDLADVVHDCLEMIRPVADAANIKIRTELAPERVGVFGDPEELSKVVINLFSNAVKYSRPNDEVVVQVTSHDTYAEVCVIDQGIGISRADLTTLFSAFNRSSNQEALSIPGTGLGLAISRRIAQMNGGEILVDSALGEGSTFRFRLPVREVVAEAH